MVYTAKNRTGGEFCSRIFIYAFIKCAYCVGFKGLYGKFDIKSTDRQKNNMNQQNSPHIAMNIANSTVPLLSNSMFTCRADLKRKQHWAQTNKENTQLSAANTRMYLGIRAGVGQVPHFASFVAKRTHDGVSLTDLLSVKHNKHRVYYREWHRYRGAAEKLTWEASCWRRPDHKERLWPQ